MNINYKNIVSAVIPAAGSGSRMNADINKQFIKIDGIPVLIHTLRKFDLAESVDEVIVVAAGQEIKEIEKLIRKYNIKKVRKVVIGGNSRQESVKKGLDFVTGDKVLIHDGARPFVSVDEINSVVDALADNDGAAVGVYVKDTVKRVDKNGIICETLNRDELVQIRTPQGFKTDLIKEAHIKAEKENIVVTDDCALAEYLNIKVVVIEGSSKNIKITVPEDIGIGEAFLKAENK